MQPTLPTVRSDFYDRVEKYPVWKRGAAFAAVEPPSSPEKGHGKLYKAHVATHYLPRAALLTSAAAGDVFTVIGISGNYAAEAYSNFYKSVQVKELYDDGKIVTYAKEALGTAKSADYDDEKLKEIGVKKLQRRYQIKAAISIIVAVGSVVFLPFTASIHHGYKAVQSSFDLIEAVKNRDVVKAAESIAFIAIRVFAIVAIFVPDPTTKVVAVALFVAMGAYNLAKAAYMDGSAEKKIGVVVHLFGFTAMGAFKLAVQLHDIIQPTG